MAASYAAAVEGRHNTHMTEIKFMRAAQMHTMCFAAVFTCEPCYFGGADYSGVAGFGDVEGAAYVVKVRMAD